MLPPPPNQPPLATLPNCQIATTYLFRDCGGQQQTQIPRCSTAASAYHDCRPSVCLPGRTSSPSSASSCDNSPTVLRQIDLFQILLPVVLSLLPQLCTFLYRYLRQYSFQILVKRSGTTTHPCTSEDEQQPTRQGACTESHAAEAEKPDCSKGRSHLGCCNCHNKQEQGTQKTSNSGSSSTMAVPNLGGTLGTATGAAGGVGGLGGGGGNSGDLGPERGLNVGSLVGVGSNKDALVSVAGEETQQAEADRKAREERERQQQQGGAGQGRGGSTNSGAGGGGGVGGGANGHYGDAGSGGGSGRGTAGQAYNCGCNHAFYPVCQHNQAYSVPITFYFSHAPCSTCQPNRPPPNSSGSGYGGGSNGGGSGAQSCSSQPPRRQRVTVEQTAEVFARQKKDAGDPRDLRVIYQETLNDITGKTDDGQLTDRSGTCPSCGKPWSNHPAH